MTPLPLRLRLDVPERVRLGEPVAMVLRAENAGGRPLDLYLRGRVIAFDLIVTDTAGALVWRRLHDEMIPAIARIETLGPRAALELSDTWDQRTDGGEAVAPGDYGVRGELLAEDAPLVTSTVPLTILPG